MRKFVGMTNKEWAIKHNKMSQAQDYEFFICPDLKGLDNHIKPCNYRECKECWSLSAKRNGKYILKEVKE